jgi:hypothetical protein
MIVMTETGEVQVLLCVLSRFADDPVWHLFASIQDTKRGKMKGKDHYFAPMPPKIVSNKRPAREDEVPLTPQKERGEEGCLHYLFYSISH